MFGPERINVKLEYELLSTPGKKLWDSVAKDLKTVFKEMNLSARQKDALVQRYMAEVRYEDLLRTNEYLNRTHEEYSQNAIRRNKLAMAKLDRVYKGNESCVREVKDQVEERMKALSHQKQVTQAK